SPKRFLGIDEAQTLAPAGFEITAIPAAHETVERDEWGSLRFVGYVVRCGKWTIYHSGDTVLYDGMVERLSDWRIDVALLPINSRYILPWFGGTPPVWTTAMLFFQTLLFAGYAYAHLSGHYFKPLWQVGVHLALLMAAAISLPFVPDASWKPVDGSNPVLRI